MDLVFLVVALVGLIVLKGALANKERGFRKNRDRKKIQQVLDAARRNLESDQRQQSDLPSSGKKKSPPPLPPGSKTD
ncbi:MAG: hypothetical protein CMI30_01155 [Opitutae bacterium]|jgi:type II secretory pathway pseudopilin PulG|nr:hypothetical protein [Opitutae bacterium]|tara:strand:+ start:10607 stop:10837 length:231 start_codon:yes stop_codon:yes gene_type:complete